MFDGEEQPANQSASERFQLGQDAAQGGPERAVGFFKLN
jgi:hypothetical protein